MQKSNCLARRGHFFSGDDQLHIFHHQTLWFVPAFATPSHLPWTFQTHAARRIGFYVPPRFYLFCQCIIFRGCYARCSHLHSFLLWKWSTESPSKFRFHCSRLTIRAAFIFYRPMYMVAVLSQYHFYIFEFQCFFA